MRLVLAFVAIGFGCGTKESGDASKQPARPVEMSPPAAPADAAPAVRPGGVEPVTAIPLYFERALTAADLEKRTLRELSLMRNTIFARAGNTFRKKWLRDHFAAQPWYKPLAKLDESRVSALDRANARLIAQAEATVKKADLEAAAARIRKRMEAGRATPEEEIEIRLLSERLGKWVGGGSVAASDKSPLEEPSHLDKLLTIDQLANLSRRDLRILRNLVYARHGYQFKSDLLDDYFRATAWYKPDPGFTEKRLSEIDRKNLRIVRSVEDSLGGPLSDKNHLEQEGWLAVS